LIEAKLKNVPFQSAFFKQASWETRGRVRTFEAWKGVQNILAMKNNGVAGGRTAVPRNLERS
jgi:hypothetical protein